MTKFQALFVLWLRHEQFCDCSWRALAGYYNARYTTGTMWNYTGIAGNQIYGIELEREAFEILFKDIDPMIVGMNHDLGECDLTYIQANLKRHLKEL